MDKDQLAALDRAARQGVPVTGNDWLRQFSDDRQLADVLLALYRANQIAVIGSDAVEALAELQLAAFLAGRGSVVTKVEGRTVSAKPAPTVDDFRRMALAALGRK